TAENLKVMVGSAFPSESEKEVTSLSVRGRDLVTGLPQSIDITTEHVYEAIQESLMEVIMCIKMVLEKTPPELSGDIIEKGIVLTGGGAQLEGLERLVSQHTGVPAFIAEDPVSCVAKGAGKVLEHLDQLIPSLITRKRMAVMG
ncbi:MAG: rod shape-determining protein, partial [Candidatus Contubernalis sp.]|nr:rod shape-determining protein [Candidatus Contubernalis sp.]